MLGKSYRNNEISNFLLLKEIIQVNLDFILTITAGHGHVNCNINYHKLNDNINAACDRSDKGGHLSLITMYCRLVGNFKFSFVLIIRALLMQLQAKINIKAGQT